MARSNKLYLVIAGGLLVVLLVFLFFRHSEKKLAKEFTLESKEMSFYTENIEKSYAQRNQYLRSLRGLSNFPELQKLLDRSEKFNLKEQSDFEVLDVLQSRVMQIIGEQAQGLVLHTCKENCLFSNEKELKQLERYDLLILDARKNYSRWIQSMQSKYRKYFQKNPDLQLPFFKADQIILNN